MGFMDIINEEQKKLEQGNNSEKVKYPETKHPRLFMTKDQRELLLQVLPAANLVGQFALPTRKIFLTAKSSKGKDLNSNFTLDAEPNEGSYLEQKIAQWTQMGAIPNSFGGQQSAKKVFLVNAVKVVPNPAQPGTYMQERDENGQLAVRVYEMPQSAYSNYLRKLVDPMYNTSGTDLSFMDPNKAAAVKISKPAKGQMEYPVDVYTNVMLPPLGQGWENQLENLSEHAIPTERLENGQEWVNAFIDMKEGRKPQQRKDDSAQGQQQQQPQSNPYTQQQQQLDPFANQAPQQQQQQPDPFANPAPQQNTYQQQSQLDPFANQAPQQQSQPDPFANPAPQQQSTPAPQPDPFANTNATPSDPFAGSALGGAAPQQQSTPAPQQQQQFNQAPQQQSTPAPQQQQQSQPSHNIDVNSNGLMDIDAMLDAELNQ